MLPINLRPSNALTPSPAGALRVPALPFKVLGSSDRLVYLSLIIPTYNEGRNVHAIVKKLAELLDEFLPNNYELIVVDDDSPDRTWDIAQSLVTDYPQLKVMRRQQERGLSSAVIRGWQVASGAVLGVIDGDLQHPPEVLLNLLQAIAEGADLAVASRHVEGGGVSDWGLVRRLLSRGAQTLGLIVLPSVIGRVSDPMSGYFVVRRSAIAECELYPTGYKILLEVLGRGSVDQIAEVAYVFQERQEGKSKVTWKQYIEYLHHLLRLRFRGQMVWSKQQIQLQFSRFFRFGLVGLSGVFVDMAMLYLLSDPTMLALPLTRSKILAAEVAIFNNFLWNDFWTFGDISSRQQGTRQRIKRFIKFNLVCLMGLILNVLILNFLFNVLGINRYVANLFAIAIVTVWNFWINLKLSWRVTQV